MVFHSAVIQLFRIALGEGEYWGDESGTVHVLDRRSKILL